MNTLQPIQHNKASRSFSKSRSPGSKSISRQGLTTANRNLSSISPLSEASKLINPIDISTEYKLYINNYKKKKLKTIESSFPGIGYVIPYQEFAESTVLITGSLYVFENSKIL